MSTHLVATHESTETRDWLCASCHAFGHATVHARGEGERQVWWSRDKAAEGAHEEAAVALEKDAQRILSLVRCPSCNRRAPGAVAATLWHGLKDLGVAITSSVTIGVVVWVATDSSLLGIVALAIAFLVLLAIGAEARRWREAARVVARVPNPRKSQHARAASNAGATRSSQSIAQSHGAQPVPATVEKSPAGAPSSAATSVPPPIVLSQPVISAPVPMAPGDPSDQPTFLR